MKKLNVLILFVLITPLLQAQAVDQELKGLIQKSFNYFPRIHELEEQVEVNNLRKDVVQSGYRPLVTGNASYSYLNPVSIIPIPTGPTTTTEFQTQPYNNQNANIAVNQLLYDFGKMKHSIEKAKYDILIAHDNLELNKTVLASQVAGVYFSIIYLERTIIVQDSVIAYFQEYKKFIDNKIKRGDALEFDALSAQSNVDQAQNRKVDLQNLLDKQYNLLAYTTGDTRSSLASLQLLDFPLGAVSEDSLLSVARRSNMELSMSRNRILQQEEEIKVNQKNFMPTLSLTGAAGVRNGYQPDIQQNRFNYLIGAGLSIPIYTGNKNRDQQKIAEHSLTAAKYASTGAEIAVKRDMDQAIADIHASSDRLNNIESQIAQAKRALELATSRFKNGTITYVELLNAQTNLHQAHQFKLQYAYQLTLAKVELARLLGMKYW